VGEILTHTPRNAFKKLKAYCNPTALGSRIMRTPNTQVTPSSVRNENDAFTLRLALDFAIDSRPRRAEMLDTFACDAGEIVQQRHKG